MPTHSLPRLRPVWLQVLRALLLLGKPTPYEALARPLEVCRRTVRRAVVLLELEGLVTTSPRSSKRRLVTLTRSGARRATRFE